MSSRALVHASLGVFNIEGLVFFILPALDHAHLSIQVMVSGCVKKALCT